ncbi:UNVERIFIED_CONTAM: hypothetical protein Slati_0975900 [Sesamum latifolium]|uniref:Uncharacterized protein n=1 Tax=Sesamum latifolium TaxID=2727402 RepID=A0AAW2XQW6_9LAMI
MEIHGYIWASGRHKAIEYLAFTSIPEWAFGSIRSWLCAGDFNEILSPDEKTGAPRPRRQIEEFRACLAEC